MTGLSVLFANPTWIIVLACIGALVVAFAAVVILFFLLHIVRGLFIGLSFMRWSLHVMKLNGRKPKWGRFLNTLFSAWWRGIGYVNNGSSTISQGRSVWRGWGDWSAIDERASKFVEPEAPAKQVARAPSKPKPKPKAQRMPRHAPRPALVPLQEIAEPVPVQIVPVQKFEQFEQFEQHDDNEERVIAELLDDDADDRELDLMVASGPRLTPTVDKYAKRKKRK